jgi:hypothetical protein
MSNHRRTKIVDAGPSSSGFIHSTLKNRDLPAREKIEETILNLASALEYKIVQRATLRDGTTIYRVENTFHRGANAILELSRLIVARAS